MAIRQKGWCRRAVFDLAGTGAFLLLLENKSSCQTGLVLLAEEPFRAGLCLNKPVTFDIEPDGENLSFVRLLKPSG